jgi:hypothetical protein
MREWRARRRGRSLLVASAGGRRPRRSRIARSGSRRPLTGLDASPERNEASLRVTPWRRPIWDELPQKSTMASHELVHRVNECGCAERSQHAAQQARQAEFGEQRDAASAVARNGLAIAEDESPAFRRAHPRESMRAGGRPLDRRGEAGPAARPGQVWRKAGGRDDVSVDVLRHADSLRRERFGAPLRP